MFHEDCKLDKLCNELEKMGFPKECASYRWCESCKNNTIEHEFECMKCRCRITKRRIPPTLWEKKPTKNEN